MAKKQKKKKTNRKTKIQHTLGGGGVEGAKTLSVDIIRDVPAKGGGLEREIAEGLKAYSE